MAQPKLGKRLPHSSGDFVDLLGFQVRAHWQTEHSVGKIFSQRIGAPSQPEVGIGLLQMWRDGVMHQRADTLAVQCLDQLHAVRRANDIREGEEIDATAFKALIRAAVTFNRAGTPKRAKPVKR